VRNFIQEAQIEQDIQVRTAVFEAFNSGDDISIPLIQRKCRCGYNSAYRVLENLIEDDLVEKSKTPNGVSKFL
jgi:hypothetical protein